MKLRHICEVCGKDEVLDSEVAHKTGWDYPPHMGAFGVVSPRVCPDCPMTSTVWWAITTGAIKPENLTAEQLAVVERIQNEPESIHVN